MLRSCAILFCTLMVLLTSPGDLLAGEGIERTGDVVAILLAATTVGVTTLKQDRPGLLQYGKSAAVATGVTYALKYTIDEDRPNGEGLSFPSFHSSFTFAAAEFLRRRYGWQYGLPAYAAASFVGYSRVESDHHYWHDVVAGALVGIMSSSLFSERFQRMNISADLNRNYFGIRLSRSW